MTDSLAKRKAPKDWIGLQVRLREELRQKLQATAAQNGVSMNAELIARLERSFEFGGSPNDLQSIELWRDLSSIVARVEQITHESWLLDRKTFVAVSCLFDARLKDKQPPFENESVLLDLQGKLAHLQNKIEGLLGILLDAGALRTIAVGNSISQLGGTGVSRGLLHRLMLANPSSESVVIIRLLQNIGYEPTVRLDDPLEDWALGDGVDAAGAQSLFRQLPRLANELNALREQLTEAFQPNDLAEAEGKRLAHSLRQRMSMSDDFGKAI